MLFSPVQMHIPDGFLSLPVALALWAISVVVVGYALRRANRDLGERQVPLMGVLAEFIKKGVTMGHCEHPLLQLFATRLYQKLSELQIPCRQQKGQVICLPSKNPQKQKFLTKMRGKLRNDTIFGLVTAEAFNRFPLFKQHYGWHAHHLKLDR